MLRFNQSARPARLANNNAQVLAVAVHNHYKRLQNKRLLRLAEQAALHAGARHGGDDLVVAGAAVQRVGMQHQRPARRRVFRVIDGVLDQAGKTLACGLFCA